MNFFRKNLRKAFNSWEKRALSIMHRRVDGMEQKLDAALDRDTSMARTQTALLEASSRLTETITAIRNEFQSFQVALAALDQASIARMTRA
jgi:hypothetical protein